MKNLLKKLSCLMVVAFVAVSLFSCALTPQTQLKFTAFPETEYVVGEVEEAEFLEAVKVELDGTPITLTTLKGLGATITGIHLDQVGTYTLVIVYKGASIVFEYDVVTKFEAELNAIQYETLEEAFAVANESSELSQIKVLKNVVVEPNTLIVDKTAKIQLNTNGFTIYGVNDNKTNSNQLIQNKGELEIIGNGVISYLSKYPDVEWGAKDPSGKKQFPSYADNTIKNEGKLTINGNVTIQNLTSAGGASYAIDSYQGSTTIINNGYIYQPNNIAIRLFCNGNGTTLEINGGQITGTRGIWIQLPNGVGSAAHLVNVTINGGKIHATKENNCALYLYSYGNPFDNVNVTITGGEFTGSYVAFDGGQKYGTSNVTITGGLFEFDVIRYTSGEAVILKEANITE